MGVFDKIKSKFSSEQYPGYSPDMEEDYVEVGSPRPEEGASKARIVVRNFVLEDFTDIKPVLDVLREGYTITLINIRPLREKDMVELRRAVDKLKKTCAAIEGDIAGFSDDWLVVTPSFARVYRASKVDELVGE